MLMDFTEQIVASTKTKCDGCDAELGGSYPTKKGIIHAAAPDGQDQQGYDKMKNLHFCNAKCAKSYFGKMDKSGESTQKGAAAL